jgi:glycosyltransferase involved in cell wall biosynthesis
MLSVSVVIPFHNEEFSVKQTIEKVSKVFRKNKLKGEIIAVDDRSTDATGSILDAIAKKNKLVKVIHRIGNSKNVEFGYAIRDGIRASSGDIIVIMMGDLSDDPEYIPKFLEKIREGYDIVYGSRFIRGGSIEGYPKLKLIFNRLGNFLISLLFRLKVKDITNSFKAYSKRVLDSMDFESNDFSITLEIALKAQKKGFKHVEIPVSWKGRKYGRSKMKIFETACKYLITTFRIFFYG